MGRATIVSGGAAGLYTIEQDFSLPGQDAELLRLQSRKTALDEYIVLAKEALAFASLGTDEAERSLNELIKDWQNRLATGQDPDPPIDPSIEDANDPAAVSNAASGVISAHNSLRSAAGVGSLSTSSILTASAQAHATWLANNNTSSHTGEGGSTPQQRMANAGYPTGPGTGTGENQAAGHTSVAQVMDGWMNSPGHKANVLETRYTEIGVGYAYRPLGTYRHYWVVNFGKPG